MYINSLIKIKNASIAKKETVKIPFSKMALAIAEILARHKIVEKVEVRGRLPKKIIDVRLKNDRGPLRVKFLSKPSRTVHVGYARIRPPRYGNGLIILSTPNGIKEGREAKREKVGGELLFEIY